MRKPHFKNRAARGAFTLIEILVVLVIMGFLISLVAPKLSGVVDGAIDNNCDTNQERLRKILNVNFLQNGSLPAGLANMVIKTNTGYALPTFDNGNGTDGTEMMSSEFNERFAPKLHALDAAEAGELAAMGLAKVNTYAQISEDSATTTGLGGTVTARNVSENVATGLNVLMIGVGSTTAGDYDVSGFTASTEAPMVGRIVFGVTQQSEFVTSGMLDQAGICPGQLQNADDFEFGNYVLVAPRMKATTDRWTNGTDDMKGMTITGFAKEDGTIPNYTTDVSFDEAQAQSAVTSSCPEGHTWAPMSETYTITWSTT